VIDKLPYVHKRHNKYGVRMRVSDDIRHIIGKSEITRSLGTGDPVQAKEIYYRTVGEIEADFAKARRQLEPQERRPLTKIMARQFAQSWFLNEFQKAEDEVYADLSEGNLPERLDEISQDEDYLRTGDDVQSMSGFQGTADKILIANGYPVREGYNDIG